MLFRHPRALEWVCSHSYRRLGALHLFCSLQYMCLPFQWQHCMKHEKWQVSWGKHVQTSSHAQQRYLSTTPGGSAHVWPQCSNFGWAPTKSYVQTIVWCQYRHVVQRIINEISIKMRMETINWCFFPFLPPNAQLFDFKPATNFQVELIKLLN